MKRKIRKRRIVAMQENDDKCKIMIILIGDILMVNDFVSLRNV